MKRKLYLDKKGNPLRGIVLYNRLSKEKNISLDDSRKLAKLYMNQMERESETLREFEPEITDNEQGFATLFRIPTEIEGRDLKSVTMKDGRILDPSEAAQELRAERKVFSKNTRGTSGSSNVPVFDFVIDDNLNMILL